MNKNYLFTICVLLIMVQLPSQVLFTDDFENGINKWEYKGNDLCRLNKLNDTLHKTILELTPNFTSNCVLIKDSENWNNFSIEGDVLFPTTEHNYMGFVFNYKTMNNRNDFGCIYIKGNGSYIRVNPHYDGNASRDLFEEYKTLLTDTDKITINKWTHFKAEIIENTCHFYVNNMKTPKVMFEYDEKHSGLTGFKPRFAGGICQIDNILVRKINNFSYSGNPVHSNLKYYPDSLITVWKVSGPYNQRIKDIENNAQNNNYTWNKFTCDNRGCVLAGKICRYSTDEKYGYFITEINSFNEGTYSLQFCSTDKLTVWVNGSNTGNIENRMYAWYDSFRNPDHSENEIKVKLKKGINKILVLVEGGHYGGDGFYAILKK